MQIVPGLAESWETPDDGKTWIFHLKKGVQFHDGTPFEAEAVVFSYNKQAYVRQAVLRPIESVEALGPLTVKFVLKKPMPLPSYLTHVAWPIMGPSCLDPEGNFEKPVGTGPFKFENQLKDQKIVLLRNEAYHGQTPSLEKIIFKVIPEASTRVMALETGEVDLILKVPEYEVSRLEEKEGIDVYRKLTTFTDFLQFNCKKAPFNEKEIRQSVAFAIDTELISLEILEGIGKAAKGRPYSPVMMYSNPALETYSPNLEKAKTLLLEAGWIDSDGDGILEKDGTPLQVSLLVSKGVWAARHQPMAQAIQAELAEIGIETEIQTLEGGAITQLENAGNFDMILRTGYFVWGPYPKHFFLHHSASPNSHYKNESYDKLVDSADRTADEEKQRNFYYALQDFVIEEVPAFYLVHEEKIVAANSWVKGYTISSEDPWLNLEGVYLEKT
ncbi:MAG: ABC transporter substrate-binding protein [Methanosarcinaceae archaeon]|nr:ABC transporter substrate-binding protein [Methanosarcinaceae archaeon]MDD4331712.1 ABC transporter substrate-binding protein [Methanosarcinaceae archaeon]